MILVIDNYDSFTYNLVQYIGSINPDVKVGWISDSEMFNETGSSNVLGLESTYKYILKRSI